MATATSAATIAAPPSSQEICEVNKVAQGENNLSKRAAKFEANVNKAEDWLRLYLQNGPRPLVYGYALRKLAQRGRCPGLPEGVGEKSFWAAAHRLGIHTRRDGPKGGRRWHLPQHCPKPSDTDIRECGCIVHSDLFDEHARS